MYAFEKLGPLAITTLLLSACGGSGGSSDGNTLDDIVADGETAPTVAIDNTNALDLAVAATEGAGQAALSDDLPGTTPFAVTQGSGGTNTVRLARQQQTIQCGQLDGSTGTAVIDFSDNGQSFSIVYNCSTITGGFSGEYIPDAANWTMFTASYDNLRVQDNTINGSISCNRPSADSFDFDCSYGINGIEGLTGNMYSIKNSTVTGNDTTGYNMKATVTDPSIGAVDYTGTNIFFGECEYGVPTSGTLSITGLNGTQAVVTYIDCNTFSIAVGTGAVVTYSWSDIAIRTT